MGLGDWWRARRDRKGPERPIGELSSGSPGAVLALPGTVAQLFDPDRPRRISGNDPLRRDRWVQVLEKQLKNIPITDSFVFSLEGPWGSGKTSVLDTIEADLTADDVLVLRFNPWLFAGAQDLVGAFFRELAAQLKQKQSRFKELGKVFGGLASLLGVIGLAAASPVLATLQGIAKGSSEALDQASALQAVPSLLEAKRNFEKILAESRLRLIVLVDDLERLSAKEALDVLRAVRVIADLPGLIYVLAFDREQLVKALESAGEDGRFLDKIIQIPMRLPAAPSDALRALLFQKLDAVLAQVEHADLDKMRWFEAARDVVFPLAKTPRDITRLANAVAVALAHLGKRVALEDVITMEALRVFEPRFFNCLSGHRTFLTAGEDTQVELVRSLARHDRTRTNRSSVPPIIAGAASAREELLALARDRRVCEEALKRVFPPLGEIDGHGDNGHDRRRARRARRVCVTEVFDLYFEAEPRTQFLDLAFVAALVEADAARVPELVESTTPPQLEYVFNALGDHAPAIVKRVDLARFVIALLTHARRLPSREPEFFVDRPEMAPARFVFRLLEELEGAVARRALLQQLLAEVTPELAGTFADVVLIVEKSVAEIDLTREDLAPILDALRGMVRNLDANALVGERAPSWLLLWAFDPADEAQRTELQHRLKDERLFAAFVSSALRRSRYSTGHLELEYRGEPYVGIFDETELRQRLTKLVETDQLSTAERVAVTAGLERGPLIGRAEERPANDDQADDDTSVED